MDRVIQENVNDSETADARKLRAKDGG